MSYNWDTNEFDYDVITDAQLEDINELENAELNAEFEPFTEECKDDDEPVTGYAFTRHTYDNDDELTTTTNHKTVVSDYLPDVLRAFEDFLRDAGFTYVRSLGAECEGGNVTWSSAD